ncbi:hypothetical protein [Rhizobium sp. G21]|uniref:hypothetical protein n=1 Tax=Rhizobium sp. G21 TaxID=2758439 RepID=UPI0016045163|nr:hypothetical protein [Rhizobium sp. G21]MBB1249185.1 hypothetical protein [Rhizobium sp. G21]
MWLCVRFPSALFMLLIPLFVASCGKLPGSGPSYRQIDAQASNPVRAAVRTPYVLTNLSLDLADRLNHAPMTASRDAPPSPTAPQQTLGVGDLVDVTIFESQSGACSFRTTPEAVPAITSPSPDRRSMGAA